MKILVACEVSGKVRDAFNARGHSAWSCDTEPTDRPGNHHQCDIREVLHGIHWDMLIAFPPCTHLCASGARWWKAKQADGRQQQAIDFVKNLWGCGIERICIENPVGILSRHLGKATDIIQPHEFGHDASKKTCLWLKGLPKLRPTGYVPPRIINNLERWGNQSDSGQNNMSSSWSKIRSETYQGVADAMAGQWG